MNTQARAEFEQTDAELNKTYEALLTKLPDVGKQRKSSSKANEHGWPLEMLRQRL